MKLTLYTEGFFDAAHCIKNHPRHCAALHGHTWKVSLWVRGDENLLNEIGILWDFGNLKTVTQEFDHTNLNDIIKDNPTAENLTIYIYKALKKKDPQLEFKVRVYESIVSKKSFCEGGDF